MIEVGVYLHQLGMAYACLEQQHCRYTADHILTECICAEDSVAGELRKVDIHCLIELVVDHDLAMRSQIASRWSAYIQMRSLSELLLPLILESKTMPDTRLELSKKRTVTSSCGLSIVGGQLSKEELSAHEVAFNSSISLTMHRE